MAIPLDDDPNASTGYDVANGTDLNQGLGFIARSAIIDNNTSAFCFQPDSGLFIPPRQGRSVGFPATRHGKLQWKAPPGYAQAAAVAAERAQVRFYAAAAPPGSGLASPQLSGLQTVGVQDGIGNGTWNDTGT